MKMFASFLCTAVVATLFFCGTPLETADLPQSKLPLISIVKKAKWMGVWDYSVQDVPPEFSKGVLHVTKKKKVYTVKVELPAGTLDTENVIVKKNALSFSLSLEGQQIDVSLLMDGDNFSGESISPDGVFKLEGTRR